MPSRVLVDGRIIIEVTIRSSHGVTQNLELIADTGAQFTLIPLATVNYLDSQDPHAGIALVDLQPIVIWDRERWKGQGLTLEVPCEDHSGGNRQIRKSQTFWAHDFGVPEVQFVTAVGLLGMDIFDELGIDPVKKLKTGRPFLARRK